MSFAVFLQIFANILFITGFLVVFARLRRPAKDDPRMSRGLQMLSSKIAVLEDLSDRTEAQVQQLVHLLDQKAKEVQGKIDKANEQNNAIHVSMSKSLEVAKIFQDKIPHDEIIERQNSMKYIRAARLAHAGVTVEAIAREVDLPMGEIEFIAKVNRENLTFREDELPAWAKDPSTPKAPEVSPPPVIVPAPAAALDDFARLGEEFRKAMSGAPGTIEAAPTFLDPAAGALSAAREMAAKLMNQATNQSTNQQPVQPTAKDGVRRVTFPRIDATPADWRP